MEVFVQYANHDVSVYVCHELELNDARRTSEVQAADLVLEAADIFAQLDLDDDDHDHHHHHHCPNPVVQIHQMLLQQDLLLALLKCVVHHSAPAHDRHTHCHHGLHDDDDDDDDSDDDDAGAEGAQPGYLPSDDIVDVAMARYRASMAGF